jgi:hypothetical protein
MVRLVGGSAMALSFAFMYVATPGSQVVYLFAAMAFALVVGREFGR